MDRSSAIFESQELIQLPIYSAKILEIWSQLPELVRNDECFREFRWQYENSGLSDLNQMNSVLGEVSASKDLLRNRKCQRNDDYFTDSVKKRLWTIGNIKIVVFTFVWIIAMFYFLTVKERLPNRKIFSVHPNETKAYNLHFDELKSSFGLVVFGPFLFSNGTNNTDNRLTISLEYVAKKTTEDWYIPLVNQTQLDNTSVRLEQTFQLYDDLTKATSIDLAIIMKTNSLKSFFIEMSYIQFPTDKKLGALYAGIILILLNVLIVSEIVHRTFAAVFAAFISIGTLAAVNDRPTMDDMIKWIDAETLLLIFSMMIVVAILMDTGIFDYIAVYTFQISKGRLWRLVVTLSLISAGISVFLDNVTTILLMTPVTIKLCECLNLNPVPILPIIILNTNIAGLTTLIGHPPNLMITANSYVARENVTFLTYTLHMSLGVLLALIQTNIQFRLQNKDLKDKLKIQHVAASQDTNDDVISLWKNWVRALSTMAEDTKPLRDILIRKIQHLKIESARASKNDKHHVRNGVQIFPETFESTLKCLKMKYPIRDKLLLKKSGLVLIFVIGMFFIQSVPEIRRLSLSWCAFVGVILLLILADSNLEILLQRIEWITLLFFAAMFITMECLTRLGLIEWIGNQTEWLILLVPENFRLGLAIIIVLWISAFTSTVVDSIPVTAMMVKIVVSLAQNTALNLPIQPLVWALAYGPTIGGNGSLYGASSNIVCAGVAEKLGHKITFFQYFWCAFPIMLINVFLVTCYLLIAHVLFHWH